MKEVAIVMTIDFGRNHFNVILLEKHFRLISSKGTIITARDEGHRILHEQIAHALGKFRCFFQIPDGV